MTEFKTERELLREVRERMDDWLLEARDQAFTDLFGGPEAGVSEDDLRLIDRIDSALIEEEGQGVWDADEYGIVPTGRPDEESTPRIVCTMYPQLPEYGYPGEETLDDESRSRLNDALWDYSERVVELVQKELDGFVLSAEVEAWEE